MPKSACIAASRKVSAEAAALIVLELSATRPWMWRHRAINTALGPPPYHFLQDSTAAGI